MFQSESSFRSRLLEIKRQQWAREKEEANQEWSPWGRPGGGAPIKIVNSNNSNNSRSNDASQSDARLTPIDRQVRTVLPPLPAVSVTAGPSQHPAAGRTSATPRAPTGHHHHHHHHHNNQHHPPSSRKSGRHVRVSQPTDAETGETSGYQSDNASVTVTNRMVGERKKWVHEGARSPGPSDAYYAQHPSENLPHLNPAYHQHQQHRLLAPPRWVERSTSAHIHLGHVSDPVERLDIDFDAGPRADAGGAFYETHHTDSGFPLARATTTASSFLRGQNVPVDAWMMAEREMKRRHAVDLQQALLQQLAEKESKRQRERERLAEEERRQEEQLLRQLDAEKRLLDEEQKKIKEKKEKEQRRLDAVHSAIVDAQQAALAEKLAKKRKSTVHLEVGPPISDRRSVSAVSPAPSQAAPSTECGTNPQVQVVPPVPAIRLVDAQIQTEVDSPVLDRPCNCGPKTRVKIERRPERQGCANGGGVSGSDATEASVQQRGAKNHSTTAAAAATAASGVGVNRRPQWGSHQSSHKYMTNSEKDPRFLKRRRERLRRRQRAFLEKQLHGSWPSSESSGSREEIFFPFLPSARSPVERYYDASRSVAAAAASPIQPVVHQQVVFPDKLFPAVTKRCSGREEPPEPLPLAPPLSSRTTADERSQSPPVPALLKKIRLANGEQVTEKHEWEDYEEDRADEPDKKISKDFENLKIQGDLQPSAPVDPEQEKQDLLFRLSLLKRGLEQKRTALDDQLSIISSSIQ